MPPTSPIPAPGRYDARRGTRLQYTRAMALLGWDAMPEDERRWLDTLYWGEAPFWPCKTTTALHDDREGDETEVAVPSLGDGRSSIRCAPIVQTKADAEPYPPKRQQSFRDFWRWWIESGRPTLNANGKITLKGLSGAPLLKVTRRKEPRRAPNTTP